MTSKSLNLPLLNAMERKTLGQYLNQRINITRNSEREHLIKLLKMVQANDLTLLAGTKEILTQFVKQQVKQSVEKAELDCLNMLFNLVTSSTEVPAPEPKKPTPAPPAPVVQPDLTEEAIQVPVDIQPVLKPDQSPHSTWQDLKDFCNQIEPQFLTGSIFGFDAEGRTIGFCEARFLKEAKCEVGYGLEPVTDYPDLSPTDIQKIGHYLEAGTPTLKFRLIGEACKVCGCTDNDCSQCIEATGVPCYWVAPGLCSRCATEMKKGGRNA